MTLRNHQWYRVVLRRLSPFFNYCHESLLKEKFTKKLIEDPTLFWLSHPALIYEAITLLQSRDDKCVAHEVLLSISPMLERSLGSVRSLISSFQCSFTFLDLGLGFSGNDKANNVRL